MSRIIFRGIKTKTVNNFIMPKKKQSTTEGSAAPPVEKSSVSKNKDGAILISLQVKPGAKTNLITSISDDAVSFDCSSPPVDGQANKEIIKYFADLLKVSKADIDLKGGKSRQKVLTIRSEKLTNTSQALDILLQECRK